MIRTIALREIRDHLLSLRFYAALLLCLVLMVIGALVLSQEQGEQREGLEPFLAEDQYREVAERADSNYLMNGGLFLTRSLPRLRALVYGLHDLSFIAQIKGANQVLYLRRPLVDNPVGQLFTSFDALFIFGVLLSLVAITFTYDAVAGESEEGTLRLVLSHSLPRGKLLIGKWLGSFASLTAIAAPCALAALLVGSTHRLVEFRGEDVRLLLLIGIACLLYLGVFVSLGLLISCRCRERRTALLAGLSVWALLVWVLPSFGVYLGANLAGGTSSLQVEGNINYVRAEAERQAWARVTEFIQERGWAGKENASWNLQWGTWSDAIPRLMGELSEEEQKELASFATAVMREQLKEMEEQAARLKGEHLRRRRLQVEAEQILVCTSPLGAFTFLLTDLSQTGLRSEFHFRSRVERFKRDLVGYLYRQMEGRSMWDPVDAETFPFFSYGGQEVWFGLETGFYALLLVLFNLLFFSAAHLSFLRYEI